MRFIEFVKKYKIAFVFGFLGAAIIVANELWFNAEHGISIGLMVAAVPWVGLLKSFVLNSMGANSHNSESTTDVEDPTEEEKLTEDNKLYSAHDVKELLFLTLFFAVTACLPSFCYWIGSESRLPFVLLMLCLIVFGLVGVWEFICLIISKRANDRDGVARGLGLTIVFVSVTLIGTVVAKLVGMI